MLKGAESIKSNASQAFVNFMTNMTRFCVAAATIMGLLMSISLVPVNAYGQENEVNLTEFRNPSGEFQRTFDAKAIFS
ncbi:MAG: hypothetical protein H0X50_08830 [Nitrosopumilus sp.]|nr:hypothetical protein [Nitrosopumilus sp.]